MPTATPYFIKDFAESIPSVLSILVINPFYVNIFTLNIQGMSF